MYTILFVCMANRYRSPIAAACFKDELTKHGLERDWNVVSAGTWTTDGLPAVSEAIRNAKQFGLDIRGHRSRVVTPDILQQADLVLVMEQGQKEALRNEFQAARHKIFLLTEIAKGIDYDIPDPMADSSNSDVTSEIVELIHAGFEKIYGLTSENFKRR